MADPSPALQARVEQLLEPLPRLEFNEHEAFQGVGFYPEKWVRDLVIRLLTEQQQTMPVPRCEGCKEFKPELHASNYGWCHLLNVALPTKDFGCIKWAARTPTP